MTHINLGLALERQGNLEEAVAAYRNAIQVSPTDPGRARRQADPDTHGRTLASHPWLLCRLGGHAPGPRPPARPCHPPKGGLLLVVA